ncbi:MAG TPA: glycoside hydrolase family 9 protein [Streptosporangiaceae bacterium]|nr:glycoside hydrolase family 9 protein [Streptosporangiaceae bacterium]
MSVAPKRRTTVRAAVAAALALATAGCSGSGTSHPPAGHPGVIGGPQVRVNQVGYPMHGPKVAFAMLPGRTGSVSYTVSGPEGVVYRGRSSDDLGTWNSHYGAVYQLGFSSLTQPGRYSITIDAGHSLIQSPPFAIAAPADLYHQLVLNAVRYFTSERDGPDVVHSVLDREPANLTDEHAYVYATPPFSTDGSDNVIGTFHKIGGPVDASGGWFDAGGGYEKFAYTVSYADALLLMAARAAPFQYPTLRPEAQFGLDWLTKLWNPTRKVLYIQVGIGNGNASGSIQGDYNFWFLPQAEDHLNVTKGGNPGPSAYYVKYRPVLEAAPPGQPIDPDFAGRFAADFALGAQLDAVSNPPAASHLLSLARSVYAMAKTTHVGQIITAWPYDFYPGTEWKSDMAWGAAEIALADEALHAPASQVSTDLATAAQWARAYIAQGHPANGGDTLNLYDNGAVAEAELLQAMRQTSLPAPIPPSALLNDLAAQLRLGESYAKGDPFSPGVTLGPNDATPHAFGLYITDALYQKYGGSSAYQAFAQQQLNFALGANAWGTSFVVGAGTTFPHCLQSEIANLSGGLHGEGVIQVGATGDGPSSPGNFQGLGMVPGMRICHGGPYQEFDTSTAAFEDRVISWPSVEPADDYVAGPLLAFTLGGLGLG